MGRPGRPVAGARTRVLTAVVGALVGAALVAVTPGAAPATAVPARPGHPTAGEPPARTAAAAGTLRVDLASVAPAVALAGGDVTLSGTLTNTGPDVVTDPTVTVRAGATLTRRAEVSTWSADAATGTGATLARTALRGAIEPGGGLSFTITVPAVGRDRPQTWGAVPVSIDAGGPGLHTFLGYQRVKQYVPLDLAVAAPLVRDPVAALDGGGPSREQAWQTVTGPGSRLARIIDATADHPVTWIVDPALVTPAAPPTEAPAQPPTTPATPPPSAATTATDDTAYAATATEAATRTALADRIVANASGHSTVVLPVGDPDVLAVGAAGPLTDAMRTAVERADTAARALGATSGIAWAAGGAWSPSLPDAARAAYGDRLRAVLVSSAWFTATPTTPGALHESASGLPLLAGDARLGDLLGATSARGSGALLAQRLVAETAVLLGELPGTARAVAAVAPRAFDPDPAALEAVLSTMTQIPWVTPVTLPTLLTGPDVRVGAPPKATPALPASPLTPAAATALAADLDRVAALAPVRGDGLTWAQRWRQTATGLLATSWRDHPGGWATVSAAVHAAATEVGRGVRVAPRQINFLADAGRIQIVVVNDLDVPVRDLTLTLTPDSPILRLDTASVPLTIDARSRTAVVLQATALAAGSVPIRTTISAPGGTVIRENAAVQIRVTPTGAWLYWAIGAVALLLLLIGLLRTWRRRRRPATDVRPVGPGAGPATGGPFAATDDDEDDE